MVPQRFLHENLLAHNNLWLCYYLQVNSLRLKSNLASKCGQVNTFGGIIYFAVDGTLFIRFMTYNDEFSTVS